MTPQLEKKTAKVSTMKNCIGFSHSFYWFENIIKNNIIKASNEFWNVDVDVSLFSIDTKPNFLWKLDDYLVTQIPMYEGIASFIRISSGTVKMFLDNTLGHNTQDFKLRTITELEGKIVISFNHFLSQSLKEIILPIESINAKPEKIMAKMIHFCLLLSPKNSGEEVGMLILSLPQKIIALAEELPVSEELLDIRQFNDTPVAVDIFAGSSKITLEDLKNLEPDDILILENSNIHKMKVKGELEFEFNVNPSPKLVIDFDNEEGGDSAVSEKNAKDLWDNIQVEVGAEFKKIKLTLGELRQISEGLVIDLAPVFKNEIMLNVENSPVAAGELVIIGDRYGVKLTDVFRKDMTSAIEEAQNDEDAQDADIDDKHDNEEDEDMDFDYSDFEIDDDI